MNVPPVQYTTTSDGCRIAYAVSGAGAPFVFMPPGWSYFDRYWRTPISGLWKELQQRFRLIQYDSRGQGSSARGLRDRVSIEDYERDLEAVLERVGAERYILFALSIFTHVAIRHAAKHPDRVEALILWGVADARFGWQTEGYANLARTNWESFLYTSARVGFTFLDTETVLPIMMETISQDDWLKMVGAISRSDAMAYLDRIEAPTLVFYLPRSGLVSSDVARELTTRIPNARLVSLGVDDAAGLVPRDGRPPAVVPAIDAFLAEVRSVAPPGATAPLVAPLSARERDVLRLVAMGRTNRQIADELVISPNTAAKHVTSILAKVGAANRSEAAAYAVRSGLV